MHFSIKTAKIWTYPGRFVWKVFLYRLSISGHLNSVAKFTNELQSIYAEVSFFPTQTVFYRQTLWRWGGHTPTPPLGNPWLKLCLNILDIIPKFTLDSQFSLLNIIYSYSYQLWQCWSAKELGCMLMTVTNVYVVLSCGCNYAGTTKCDENTKRCICKVKSWS